MQAEKTYQLVTHHGVVFDVNELLIKPGQCCQLRSLALPFVHKHHYQVIEKIAELYERMQAGPLPCLIQVAVSRPLTRQQGDLLNEQRHSVGNIVGTVAGQATASLLGGPAGFSASLVAGILVGSSATSAAKARLPTFHTGDVLVHLSAQVKGGIGPQASSLLLIL